MIAVLLFAGKKYELPIWKRFVFALILTGMGVLGTNIMSFIESGNFFGRSFFGAVLFTPVFMILLGMLLRIKPADTLDLCAPAECMMLIFMKINCYISDCCYGRVMYYSKYGKAMRFPSQIVEGANAVIIMAVLLIMLFMGKQKGKLYAWYLVLYGMSRFALNLLRETRPFIWILPAGNFWALISFVIGAVWLAIEHKRAVRLKELAP